MAAAQLPPDVAEALRANPAAARAFDAMPAQRRAEWLRWIDRARTGRGRARRIDELLRRLGTAAPAAAATEETAVREPPPPVPPRSRPWS